LIFSSLYESENTRITKFAIYCYWVYNENMNVSLTKQLDKLVAEQVKSGLYGSSSEVVRQGLRLLKEQRQQKLVGLRREIAIGLEDIKHGRVAPLTWKDIKAGINGNKGKR
jgi:antitoxin ParD1/3/4